jgi:hypothetical protein
LFIAASLTLDLFNIPALVELHVDVGAAAAGHHVASDALEVLDEAVDARAVGIGQIAA